MVQWSEQTNHYLQALLKAVKLISSVREQSTQA